MNKYTDWLGMVYEMIWLYPWRASLVQGISNALSYRTRILRGQSNGGDKDCYNHFYFLRIVSVDYQLMDTFYHAI